MEFSEVTGFLRKAGYADYEPREKHLTFYDTDRMSFLYYPYAKKFDMDYDDGKIEKINMTYYTPERTIRKEITTLEELYDSI